MKVAKYVVLASIYLILFSTELWAQKAGFINSATIREKFPEVEQAQQRVQSMTDEWKLELDSMQQKVDNLEIEINKNLLVWTETEMQSKEAELITLKKKREDYAKSIFEPNGKYDQAVVKIFKKYEVFFE